MTVDMADVLDLISREGLVDRATLTPETRLDALAIPSLEMINILFAIEDRYKVTIEPDELKDAEVLGDIVGLVMTRAEQVPTAA